MNINKKKQLLILPVITASANSAVALRDFILIHCTRHCTTLHHRRISRLDARRYSALVIAIASYERPRSGG